MERKGTLSFGWWLGLSAFQRFFPAVGVAAYWLALIALNGLRSDHIGMGLVILITSYGGPVAHKIRTFLLPVILTGIIYDSQRFYSDYIRGPIHVTQPYNFDKFFFGIHTATGILTPNEWCQLHTHPILDVITGFFYLFFIAIFITICAYFQFWLPRTGTKKCSKEELARKTPRVMWSFLWLNLLGYSTYYWYAAAPPWYVAQYGLGPADMSARANPAGCLRFDQILGTHFFTGMYGRSADVFGAVPSLHISYPLLAAIFAFQFGALKRFTAFFYLIMCFSAVYLNHHYLLDILWGTGYTILVVWFMNWWGDRKHVNS